MKTKAGLAPAAASAIYDVLVETIDAPGSWHENFVYTETAGHCSEYRVQGSLGFGGKFWRTTGYRPDGTWGEQWRVDCYREDETPERLAAINTANVRLEGLRARWAS